MKGFPIVSADGSLTLVGWIDRSEIRYVLGRSADKPFMQKIENGFMLLERARKKRGRLANTPCLFTSRHQDHEDLDSATVGEEPEEYFTPTTAGECIQFWPWVNKVNSPVFCHSCRC
jgi:chloride channel 3/4/5